MSTSARVTPPVTLRVASERDGNCKVMLLPLLPLLLVMVAPVTLVISAVVGLVVVGVVKLVERVEVRPCGTRLPSGSGAVVVGVRLEEQLAVRPGSGDPGRG
jgi:hypothetical protein